MGAESLRIDTQRQLSHQKSLSPSSAIALPSPSVLAARVFHVERTLPRKASDGHSSIHRNSFDHAQRSPRVHRHATRSRYSAVPMWEPGALSPNFVTVRRAHQQSSPSRSENMGHQPTQDHSRVLETSEQALPQVDFQYVHDHLWGWGSAYLGNYATADVLVNAVSLRRHSVSHEEVEALPGQFQLSYGEYSLIRARVVPNSKERKPFVIQKYVCLQELRERIPASPTQQISPTNTNMLDRSDGEVRASISRHSPNDGRRESVKESVGRPSTSPLASLKSEAIPMHTEYALHFLPVLGALMLSGHVRKGDTIDLPIPNPESWRDVVAHIYTGQGVITSAMRENILFLAGTA